MPASVLIVDDEECMLDLLTMVLEEEFMVATAVDGENALRLLRRNRYDLCLLDIMMPELDGFDVLRTMRKERITVPVIFLTARAETVDRVEGLELGADDYITKPFEPAELLARIRTVLRRTAHTSSRDDLLLGGVRIDLGSREVWLDGKEIKLTRTEFDLLVALARRPYQALTREQLLQIVWGYDFEGDVRAIDTHVKNLREKFRRKGGESSMIQTVWGVGYKWGKP